MKMCSFAGCQKQSRSRGLCDPHYGQQLRGEDLRPLRDFGLPLAERIERGSVVDPQTGCRVWQGTTNGKSGYGVIQFQGKRELVHRLAWSLKNGPVPEGLVLDHLCRVRLCNNELHLEPVTQQVNIAVRGHGLAAQHARKTHCPAGHLLVQCSTRRRCLVCDRRPKAGA